MLHPRDTRTGRVESGERYRGIKAHVIHTGAGKKMGQGHRRKVSGATMMTVTMMMMIAMYDL